MQTAYVISLARRPERLASFLRHVDAVGLSATIRFEPFTAIDGSQLMFDDELRSRIRPWNLDHMDERELRGHLGCTLSHLAIWRIVAAGGETAFVFEDDARLIHPHLAPMVPDVMAQMPRDADLVWLNDYAIDLRCGAEYRIRRRLRNATRRLIGQSRADRIWTPRRIRFMRMPDVLTTAEAYVIRPAIARTLYEAIRNDLGALDRHIMQFVAAHRANVYQAGVPLFTQRDRDDSDTQSASVVAARSTATPVTVYP